MAIKLNVKPVCLSALICAFIFYSGLFQIPQKGRFQALFEENQICEISGKILSSPARLSNGSYYASFFSITSVSTSKSFSSSANGRIKIFIPSSLTEAYFPGKLFSLSKINSLNKRNSGTLLFETGAECNFTGKLSRQGFYVQDCKQVLWPHSLSGKAAYLRALCRLHFKRLMYNWGNGGGLLLALLCGAREYTAPSTQEAFRRAGLSHILALSGMHLSMFSAIAIFFGNRAGIKKLTFLLRISALAAFVWFAGFSPSLTRAFICALLTLAATIAGVRKPDMFSILCVSFLLQSAVCPQDIHESAFILSYGSLAGILLLSRFFYRFYTKLFPSQIASSLSAATSAQAFTAPISLKLFSSFCPIGIISATIVSPFVTIYIYSGLALIILSLIFPFLAKASGIFINLQYTVITYIVNFFSLIPNWHL